MATIAKAEFVQPMENIATIHYTVEGPTGTKVYESPMTGSPTPMPESIIDVIDSRVNMMGLFTSIYIGRDVFDGKNYDEEDNLFGNYFLEGGDIIHGFPHYFFAFHQSNYWIFHCFNIAYRVKHNMIPSLYKGTAFTSHSLVNGGNFPRSSGETWQGQILSTAGIRIRISQSRGDETPQFYCRVNFSEEFREINKDCDNLRLDTFKDVHISDIIKFNPEIKELEFKFDLPSKEKYPEADQSIINHYIMMHSNWVENTLMPAIVETQNKIELDIRVKTIY